MTPELEQAILFRPGDYPDRPYIISTWLESFKEKSYFAKRIRPRIFFKNHRKIVERLIAHPETLILCACYREAPEVIVGYLVFGKSQDLGDLIHFAFIKQEFCGVGLFQALLKQAEIALEGIEKPVRFTHWTERVNEIIRAFPHLVYDPYLALITEKG